MADKINGRTPEEVKKGLECRTTRCGDKECSTCELFVDGYFEEECNADALAYIQQLERERDEARNDLDTLNYANTELHSAYEAMKRERDAAVADIRNAAWCCCHVCKHYYQPDPNVRIYSCKKYGDFDKHDFIADDGSIFCGAMEWRGVQEEVNENAQESP